MFERYVAGAGSTMIARELNEQGIMTIRGNPWTSSSVMGVINNEKYTGDILLGKTFTVDPITKRKHGIIDHENYNQTGKGDGKVPQCPPEKEKAIEEALKHFQMI